MTTIAAQRLNTFIQQYMNIAGDPPCFEKNMQLQNEFHLQLNSCFPRTLTTQTMQPFTMVRHRLDLDESRLQLK